MVNNIITGFIFLTLKQKLAQQILLLISFSHIQNYLFVNQKYYLQILSLMIREHINQSSNSE